MVSAHQELSTARDLFLSEEAFEFSDSLFVVLRLLLTGEDLRSLFEEAGFPLREGHPMDIVGTGDLAVGAVVLKRLDDELKFELGLVVFAALGHDISSRVAEKTSPLSHSFC